LFALEVEHLLDGFGPKHGQSIFVNLILGDGLTYHFLGIRYYERNQTMHDLNSIRIFGLNSSREFATSVGNEFKQITDNYRFRLIPHIEKEFDDGEPYLRAEENVRRCDVFVIQSLYSDQKCVDGEIVGESIADKFVKLAFFIGSLRDASADRITAVIPYLGYSRQDRKVRSRDPVYTKYIPEQLEAVGTDRVLTMDVHNLSAFQNSFRLQTDNLEGKNLFADWVYGKTDFPPEKLSVLSPDSGGMGRSKRFRDALSKRFDNAEISMTYLDKSRVGRKVERGEIVGDVEGKEIIILDDMISSGGTIKECQTAVDEAGGHVWAACATHGLFVGNAYENLSDLDRLVITDTVNPFSLNRKLPENLSVIPTARIFAQAIRRTHVGESISALLK
jgi:ribose-phosphate pyrophosphokinase